MKIRTEVRKEVESEILPTLSDVLHWAGDIAARYNVRAIHGSFLDVTHYEGIGWSACLQLETEFSIDES